MNLYIFNEVRRGAVYGIGTYTRELIVALKGRDIHICVVNLFSDKPQIQTEETDGIKHWYFPAPVTEQRTSDIQKQMELYYRNVVYLLQLYIKNKKDLIFHLNYHHGGRFVEELKNIFDCRIVSVAHFSGWGFVIFDNLQRLRNLLKEEHPDSIGEDLKKSFEKEKSYYSKADHIICLSNYMKEIMCRDYGLDAAKISVIPNGLLDVADTVADAKFLRKKWNIPAREKVILFAGRIDEVKGVSYLIKAFREVLKTFSKCRLLIAGNGNYDIYLQEAKEICTKITFTGLLEKKDLNEIYQIADIGVVPSLFEPFGYVAVEMMMHELPVVATATSGLNEIVDESCGFKAPITVLPDSVEIDASILAQKIVYLLQNPAEAKQLGQNGRRKYLCNYSSEIFRRNMLQAYKSVCRHGAESKIKHSL
jgi:glycosyltransferase